MHLTAVIIILSQGLLEMHSLTKMSLMSKILATTTIV